MEATDARSRALLLRFLHRRPWPGASKDTITHFTLAGTMVATTPSFFGANPAEVRRGTAWGQGLRREEDLGRNRSSRSTKAAEAAPTRLAKRDRYRNKVQIDPLAPVEFQSASSRPRIEHFKRLSTNIYLACLRIRPQSVREASPCGERSILAGAAGLNVATRTHWPPSGRRFSSSTMIPRTTRTTSIRCGGLQWGFWQRPVEGALPNTSHKP
jgi:hypothetical protein